MFYITYIKKIFDCSKNESIGIIFLQMGKLCLHKLCQHKHFSTAGMDKSEFFVCNTKAGVHT